jgi:Tfp pilus assembly protein PilX
MPYNIYYRQQRGFDLYFCLVTLVRLLLALQTDENRIRYTTKQSA